MNTRIIIRESQNLTPEDEINEAIASLIAEGFRVVSATTALTPHGAWVNGVRIGSEEVAPGSAQHIYYVTTVVLEKG